MSKSESSTKTTIEKGRSVVTMVNVFDVDPARQAELIGLLERATQEVMRHLPGFVSANLQRSLDGTKVANYAQWASREHFAAVLEHPRAQPHVQTAGGMAKAKAAAMLYEVAAVLR